MVGRTHLNQATSSPLISGRTLLVRPLWRDWATGMGIAVAFALVMALVPPFRTGVAPLKAWGAALSTWWSALVVLGAAAVGCAAGALAARAWGAVRCWIAAGIVGVAAEWAVAVIVWMVWLS